ncbi:hypothetical protein [Actinoplanes regularis]|uniref:PH domain-containing protein n=1 Tax=Actinoplanes regularis TaxID=52697 RepID=A0A239AZE2_9ACTN|nr:hypothetical protein [Actinoplanes regularis]GIE87259.1 hypothetical protein Are01nite_37390 [Actinoplanes regularis]GLW30003.1 hypothetical protein Areg01_29430 [Actinoplanes regularis]SNS00910.1 hypothetical protein SAMN06264365_108226 [Actinoplanes regularis]
MDVISRTFHPAVTDAGVAIPSRHLPIVERCVDADDDAVLITRCTRPEAPLAGDYLFLLTRRRLVVIRETPVLHRLRLHLNVNLRHLSNVSWRPDLSRPALELAATAVDGVRERFRMKFSDTESVWRFESVLRDVFLRTA